MNTRISLFVLLIGWLILAISGCGPRPPGPSVGDGSFDDIAGRYQLDSVNGLVVPATIAHGGNIRVLKGEFIIRSDGTMQSITTFKPPSGGKITRKVNAAATRDGNQLFMQWQGAGSTAGTLQGQTFTHDNAGMILVYSRLDSKVGSPGPADLDADKGAMAPPVRRAPAGVFDDFNTDLVNGWDQHRNLIGYITFFDSPDSQVSVFTTADHPDLPGEADGNKVLQIDLNVKAWAGIGHYFENKAVDKWLAKDWRGHESLNFQLYGQNTNTSLYIDVMDNRNLASATGAAELFSYTFTDNFSGWREITIPFTELRRKEIGSDAPNDGLGLSHVHGWAFGALQTDGPVTYYLDDFELR